MKSRIHNFILRINSLLVFIFVTTSISTNAESRKAVDEEIKRALHEDLRVLTQTIPSYLVTQMPATKALEQLWIKACGHKPHSIDFVWRTRNNLPERNIDLELHDVPVLQVISYICELSGSHWRIRGIESVSMQFELTAIDENDCSDNWVAVGIADITDKAAKKLGLTHAMSSDVIIERLKRYGVKFYENRFPSASYDANTGKIAAIMPKDEVMYLQALARMADLGLIIEKPTP